MNLTEEEERRLETCKFQFQLKMMKLKNVVSAIKFIISLPFYMNCNLFLRETTAAVIFV